MHLKNRSSNFATCPAQYKQSIKWRHLVDNKARYVTEVRVVLQLSKDNTCCAVRQSSVGTCSTFESNLVATQRSVTAWTVAVTKLLTHSKTTTSSLITTVHLKKTCTCSPNWLQIYAAVACTQPNQTPHSRRAPEITVSLTFSHSVSLSQSKQKADCFTSSINWGICVLFPLPVSPATTTTLSLPITLMTLSLAVNFHTSN